MSRYLLAPDRKPFAAVGQLLFHSDQGLCLVGSVTAPGGGNVRDLQPGLYPLTWISHHYYVLITISATAVAASLGDGPASLIVLTGGIAVPMLAVRFHWQPRTWTAAGIDAGRAH